jgi:hypothetical protein
MVGAVQLTVALPELGGGAAAVAVTAIESAASEAAAPVESRALMTIFWNVPTLEVEGEPLNFPVALLNAAQDGLLEMENVRVRPLESVAEGVKLYSVPAVSDVAGVPEIVTLSLKR